MILIRSASSFLCMITLCMWILRTPLRTASLALCACAILPCMTPIAICNSGSLIVFFFCEPGEASGQWTFREIATRPTSATTLSCHTLLSLKTSRLAGSASTSCRQAWPVRGIIYTEYVHACIPCLHEKVIPTGNTSTVVYLVRKNFCWHAPCWRLWPVVMVVVHAVRLAQASTQQRNKMLILVRSMSIDCLICTSAMPMLLRRQKMLQPCGPPPDVEKE